MKRLTQAAALAVGTAVAGAAFALDEAASLYDQDRYKPLTSEAKAWRVGDVLTVVVQEVSSATTATDSRAERHNGIGAQVNVTKTGTHAVSAKAGTDNDGGGRTQRSGRLLATVSVRVTGYTPGGDLTVQGDQVLTLNGEKQSIAIAGVVRPRDIAGDNTVSSSRLADARIEFDGEGFLADKSKPSWIARFFTALGF